MNCDSELTADLHRIEAELGRGSCFHRHSVIRAFRHWCEEQKRSSLHPLRLFLCMLQRVLEIPCHLLQSAHLSSGFAHCGLFWLLDLLLGPIQAPFSLIY